MKKFFLAMFLAAFCMSALANGNHDENGHDDVPVVMDASTSAVLKAEQNNSLYLGGANAPAMSAASYDCNIISKSYSILIWSYGRSKCEDGSIMWRDINWMVFHMDTLGLDEESLAAAVQRRVCSEKEMRKIVGNCPAKVRVAVVRQEVR